MRVYDYQPDNGDRWCREGVATEERPGGLFDTFWSGTDRHLLTATERATAVLRFDTDDYDEAAPYARCAPEAWADRAPEDRQTITSQHGLCARWFIRKGSRRSRAQVVANAKRALDDALAEQRRAESRVRWAREDYQRAKDGAK